MTSHEPTTPRSVPSSMSEATAPEQQTTAPETANSPDDDLPAEIAAAGARDGIRLPAGIRERTGIAEIKPWRAEEFRAGAFSREFCSWGGNGRKEPCRRPMVYAVVDLRGSRWSACEGHLRARLEG